MDGLITILILYGLFRLIFGSRKKRRQNSAAKQPPRTAKPVSFRDMDAVPGASAKPAAVPKAKPAAAPMNTTAAKAKPAAATIKTAVPKTGSMEYNGLEGESEAEHTEHRERVLRLEHLQREASEAAASAYEVNLEQLRNAVIMSEILNRPVSLRKNGYHG